MSSLSYSSFGIARPHTPKNPYTNVDWTYYQLRSIVTQITTNRASVGCLLPQLLIDYHRADYCITKFAILSERDLSINAAIELFKFKDDRDTRDIYEETIHTMALDLDIIIGGYTQRMICERELSCELQARWDSLVLSIWIHSNLHTLYGDYLSFHDMAQAFRALFHETRIYVQTMYRIASAARHPLVLAQAQAQAQASPAVPPTAPVADTAVATIPVDDESSAFMRSFISILNL